MRFSQRSAVAIPLDFYLKLGQRLITQNIQAKVPLHKFDIVNFHQIIKDIHRFF